MKGKTKKRTEQESDSRRSSTLIGAPETNKDLAKWHRLQQKNLSILGLLKRKEWPQYHRESSWQVHKSRLCQKKKEQSRLCKAPDRKVGKSQGEREPHLGERGEGDQSGSMGRKVWTPQRRQVPRRKGRARKESLPGGSRRKHEQVNGSKSSPGRSAESWLHSKSGQN